MNIDLPRAIQEYVHAENSGDVEAMSDCFAPYATVRDEGRVYEGLPAIKAWKATSKRKYEHTVTPLEFSSSDDGAVLKARLAGNFPGSPITANFYFVIENDRIASLQIRS